MALFEYFQKENVGPFNGKLNLFQKTSSVTVLSKSSFLMLPSPGRLKMIMYHPYMSEKNSKHSQYRVSSQSNDLKTLRQTCFK